MDEHINEQDNEEVASRKDLEAIFDRQIKFRTGCG